jgi:hypothetical protein
MATVSLSLSPPHLHLASLWSWLITQLLAKFTFSCIVQNSQLVGNRRVSVTDMVLRSKLFRSLFFVILSTMRVYLCVYNIICDDYIFMELVLHSSACKYLLWSHILLSVQTVLLVNKLLYITYYTVYFIFFTFPWLPKFRWGTWVDQWANLRGLY